MECALAVPRIPRRFRTPGKCDSDSLRRIFKLSRIGVLHTARAARHRECVAHEG
jgi:hypothetical protein